MKTGPKKELVIFEHIGYSSLAILFYYLKMNHTVRYFTLDKNLERAEFFKKIVSNKDFSKIPEIHSDIEINYLPYNLALDNVEDTYEKFFKKDKSILLMQRLFDSELIRIAFKKTLAENLSGFYRMQLFLNDIAVRESRRIYFIPSGFIQSMELVKFHKGVPSLDRRICIPLLVRCSNYVSHWVKKVAHIILLLASPLWLLSKIKKAAPKKEPMKEYEVGIRIYRDDLEFKFKYHSVDFLLDKDNLNSDNTLFCIDTPISDEYMHALKERGYHLVELPKILESIDGPFVKQVILKKFLPCCMVLAYRSFRSRDLITKMCIKIMQKYVLWSRFFQMYRIKNYVVVNDNEAVSVARNILFAQKGVKTWYYAHSAQTDDLITPPGRRLFRNVIYSFLHYDKLVCWGDKMKRFFASHPNYIGEYLSAGCLWSEPVRLLMENGNSVSLRKKVLQHTKMAPDKIVSVFDTTFWGKNTLLNNSDMRVFMGGILAILEEHPDMAIILKKKWLWSEMLELNPECESIYDQVHSHPRCYSTNDEERDSAEVIAISDLVIAACFTSSVIESLGVRKKAMYFDATNRFSGFYFDSFPKMVAHNIPELKEFVNYWLYEIREKELDEYLRSYVIGELVAHADGQAITRFRQALCKREDRYGCSKE